MGKKIIVLAGSPGREVSDSVFLSASDDGTLGARIANELQSRAIAKDAGIAQIYFVAPAASRMPVGDRITWIAAETDREVQKILCDLLTGTVAISSEPIDAVVNASAVPPFTVMPCESKSFLNGSAFSQSARTVPEESIVKNVKSLSPETMLIAGVPVQYSSRVSAEDAALDAIPALRADCAFAFKLGDDYGRMPLAGPSGAPNDPAYNLIQVVCDTPQRLAEAIADTILGIGKTEAKNPS